MELPGAGGHLRSSKMQHLDRLLTSTKAMVSFISETRNATINRTALINHFNLTDAFVVPALGQSGGLWLLSSADISFNVVDHDRHSIFAICNLSSTNQTFALICIYGDPHHRSTQAIWTRVQNFVLSNTNLPVICTGDLNDIMNSNEKVGPCRTNPTRINRFCDYVKQCGLIDLGYSGPAYTWTNKRFSSIPTFQRLDRSLANANWCSAFPSSTVLHLPMLKSDHAPILTMFQSSIAKTTKPFRFKNYWLLEQDFNEVARSSWDRSATRTFN